MDETSQNSKAMFISYSHDTQAHKDGVLALANRLRSDGVDCHIDQYEYSPPEGWPKWMASQITGAGSVLVVCSEVYNRRVSGGEAPGTGLGSIWEGQIITQEIYNAGGKNQKFIPVLLESSDKRHIPTFLQPATRYCIASEGGYEDLYRRLTDQPLVRKPDLGQVRILDPHTPDNSSGGQRTGGDKDLSSLVLLMRQDNQMAVFSANRITASDIIELELVAQDNEGRAFLESLRQPSREPVSISYGSTANVTEVRSVVQAIEGGAEVWKLTLHVLELPANPMEVAFSNFTPDDIAKMRARRILLNEKLDAVPGDPMNQSMLEVFVEGMNSKIKVQQSPIPTLFESYGSNSFEFIAVSKLVAVALLRLTGTVDQILQFDCDLRGEALHVKFRGVRPRAYSNVEPVVISVEGECTLK